MAFSSSPFYFRLVSILVSIFFCFVIVSRFPVFSDLFLQVEREFLTSLEGMRGDLFFCTHTKPSTSCGGDGASDLGQKWVPAKDEMHHPTASSLREKKRNSIQQVSHLKVFADVWRMFWCLIWFRAQSVRLGAEGKKNSCNVTKIYFYQSQGLLRGLLTAADSAGWTCWAAAYEVAAARRWSATDASGALCDGDGAFSFGYQFFRPWSTAKRFLYKF